jgi:mannose-6-phosphate isomerase-like protein (cupin superfamily)
MTARARSNTAHVHRERDDRHDEQMAAPRAIVLGPGEGRVIPGPEGVTLKATREETAGAVGVFEATSPPGFGPPRHIHHDADELFYVLSGEFQFLVGEQLFHARPGAFVYVPRGTVHAPKVVGAGPGRCLAAFVPGGQEHAFEEFARLAAAEGPDAVLDPDRAQAIIASYNSEFVGPPL